MAELSFWTGTMDAGKSTLALQTHHNHAVRGRHGLLFVTQDRSGPAQLTSRLGLAHDAIEVDTDLDFWADLVGRLTHGAIVHYLICDEAQFYTPRQVEQLARVVDELDIDVFCFGILTDFRTTMFDGARRLVELADRTEVLQVQTLCWCGRRGTHNARTMDGVMVTEGDVVVVGDVEGPTVSTQSTSGPEVSYEVLCRRHHRERVTTQVARAHGRIPGEPLPFV